MKTRAQVAPLLAFLGHGTAVAPLTDALGEGTPEVRHAVRSALSYAVRTLPGGAVSAVLRGAATKPAAVRLDLVRSLRERLSETEEAGTELILALLAPGAETGTRYLLIDPLATLAEVGQAPARTRLRDLILHDPDHDVRAHAAEHVAIATDPGAAMLAAVTDADPRVREAVLQAIRRAPWISSPQAGAPGLLSPQAGAPGLLSPQAGAPGTAAARIVPSIVTAVTQLLTDDPWTFVRVGAAEALSTLPRTDASDKALGDALTQLSPRVRERATLSLGARGAATYRDAIRGHLTNAKEDTTVRMASAHALGMLCDGAAADALAALAVEGAVSPDAAVVSLGLVATHALGQIHPVDLGARFAKLRSKTVRPDARAAADRALAEPGHCGAGVLGQR